jgi:hypothetical protein
MRRKQRMSGSSAVVLAVMSTITVLLIQGPARADSDYEFTINTSSLLGSGSTLAFDFIGGGGTQSNSVSIFGFSTDGTLGSTSSTGSVTGSLASSASLTNASFFNELQQGITLGSTISFQLETTTNGPTGGSLPDTFSLFILDPTASVSLANTTDPTGADSLITLQIDGTPGSALSVYGSSPTFPVTVSAVGATVAPEIDASMAVSALTLLMGVAAVLRGRGVVAKRSFIAV